MVFNLKFYRLFLIQWTAENLENFISTLGLWARLAKKILFDIFFMNFIYRWMIKVSTNYNYLKSMYLYFYNMNYNVCLFVFLKTSTKNSEDKSITKIINDTKRQKCHLTESKTCHQCHTNSIRTAASWHIYIKNTSPNLWCSLKIQCKIKIHMN